MDIVVAIFGQICQAKARRLFFVVGADETIAVSVETAEAVSRGWVAASSGLHAAAGLEAGNHVGRCGIVAVAATGEFGAVGVAA